MKPTDVKLRTYFTVGVENNLKDGKFEVDDHVRISKYKNVFAKGYATTEVRGFANKQVKNTVLWTYVIEDLNGELIVGTFC